MHLYLSTEKAEVEIGFLFFILNLFQNLKIPTLISLRYLSFQSLSFVVL